MSEYLYYEFLAIDRPLDRQAQGRLRQRKLGQTDFAELTRWLDELRS